MVVNLKKNLLDKNLRNLSQRKIFRNIVSPQKKNIILITRLDIISY